MVSDFAQALVQDTTKSATLDVLRNLALRKIQDGSGSKAELEKRFVDYVMKLSPEALGELVAANLDNNELYKQINLYSKDSWTSEE